MRLDDINSTDEGSLCWGCHKHSQSWTRSALTLVGAAPWRCSLSASSWHAVVVLLPTAPLLALACPAAGGSILLEGYGMVLLRPMPEWCRVQFGWVGTALALEVAAHHLGAGSWLGAYGTRLRC